MIDRHKLGQIIQTARQKQGITQKQLAEITGLTVNYISLLETGRRGAEIATVNKIGAALRQSSQPRTQKPNPEDNVKKKYSSP